MKVMSVNFKNNSVTILNETISWGYLQELAYSWFEYWNTSFENNQANDSNWNFFIRNSNGNFIDSFFEDSLLPNYTLSTGGYVYSFESNLSFSNCLFSKCYAFQGGCVYSYKSNVNIQNCQVLSNYAYKNNDNEGLFIYSHYG